MERDNQHAPPRRRQYEHTSPGYSPTINDIWKLSVEIKEQVETIERRQLDTLSAFVTNDLNKPDFDGHRKDHHKLASNEKLMEGYKTEATKKILGIIVTFFAGLLASGLLAKISGGG